MTPEPITHYRNRIHYTDGSTAIIAVPAEYVDRLGEWLTANGYDITTIKAVYAA